MRQCFGLDGFWLPACWELRFWRGCLPVEGIWQKIHCPATTAAPADCVAVRRFVVAGVSLLALATADVWRSRDAESALLTLWTLGTFAFCWILNWTASGRTILPMAPAVSILIFRRLQQQTANSSRLHLPGKLVPLVLAGLLAVAVSWADARLANTARLAAKEIHSRYRASKSTLWFTGHWGFQYYMESYGFKPYDTQHPRIGPSDVLIVPLNNLNLPPSFMRWYSKCAKFDVASSRLLATMHPAVEAGFYTSEWGLLPFAVGPVPDERYFIASGAVVNEGGKGDITDIYGSDKK